MRLGIFQQVLQLILEWPLTLSISSLILFTTIIQFNYILEH